MSRVVDFSSFSFFFFFINFMFQARDKKKKGPKTVFQLSSDINELNLDEREN